jgi:hypothetical protein
VPDAMLAIAAGSMAELSIADVHSTSVCFIQMDTLTLVLRWSALAQHSISLHAVEHIVQVPKRQQTASLTCKITRRFSRSSCGSSSTLVQEVSKGHEASSEIHMQYRDRDGVLRTLALQLPTPQVAEDWSRALQAVLTSLPGDTAYRRWALSCMESAHGAMSLPRSRLGVLLNRVSRVSNSALTA